MHQAVQNCICFNESGSDCAKLTLVLDWLRTTIIMLLSVESTVLHSQIKSVMREIRSATPWRGIPDWRIPCDLPTRADFLRGKRVGAASLTLFPTGCQYAMQGGCTVCGEWSGSNLGDLVEPKFHVAQFAAACAGLLSSRDIEWLRIYQEGSFLNEREVSPEARRIILCLASNLRGLRRITIESRPEYISPQIASDARNCIKAPVELEIGVGLEAKNDSLRNVCLNKGTSLASYEQAVSVAHSNEILLLAYVFLKPPFLSERESIEEAVESVRYAFEIGFDEVYVQAGSVHEWSLSEMLMFKKKYSPPWLWSVLEVIRRTAHLGNVKIGGLEYFPNPSLVAQNYLDFESLTPCNCSQGVWGLIQEYNATQAVELFADVTCSCVDTWRSSLESTAAPLLQRIADILASTRTDEYIHHKLEGLRNY